MTASSRTQKDAASNLGRFRLRSLLLEFYPQAVATFPTLKHKAALEVLRAAPTPSKATTLTRRRVVALLHRCGRRNDPSLVDHMLNTPRADSLRQPEAVEQALEMSMLNLLEVASPKAAGVDALETVLTQAVQLHPLAPLVESTPRTGASARSTCTRRDRIHDPHRFPTAVSLRCYADRAPLPRATGWCTSITLTEHLALEDVRPSIGTVGDCLLSG